MKLEGYVIVQPKSYGMTEPFYPHTHTFADTAARAWRYWIDAPATEMDSSILIQRWHDRGYRVKKATLEIEE